MNSEKKSAQDPLKGIWFGLAFVLTLLAGFWFANAHQVQTISQRHASEALTAAATVTGKDATDKRIPSGKASTTSTAYSVDVTFWTDEEQVLATVDRLVSPSLWSGVAVGDEVVVSYLPGDPENTALLKVSLQPSSRGLFERYVGVLITALCALASVVFGLRKRRRDASRRA